MKKLLLFAFLFSSLLAREVNDLTVFAGISSTKVANCVDVISGCYFISEPDLVVEGAERIKLHNNYVSQYPKASFSGWYRFAHTILSYHPSTGALEMTDKDGVKLIYCTSSRLKKPKIKKPFWKLWEGKRAKRKRKEKDAERKEEILKPYPARLLHGKRLAGLSHAPHDGGNNVINNYVELTHDKKYVYVYTPSGNLLIYRKIPSQSPKKFESSVGYFCYYLLIEERNKNGRKLLYSYNDKNQLTRIKTTNLKEDKTYSSVHFTDLGRNFTDLDIATSDGKSLNLRYSYYQAGKLSINALTESLNSSRPNEKYHYNVDSSYGVSLTTRQWPEGRKMVIEYYQKGQNQVYGQTITITSQDDKRIGRVKALKSPVKDGEEIETIYEFIYEIGKVGETPGTTYVYDVDKNLTTYYYSSYLRLEKIEKYENRQNVQYLKAIEKFVWGKEGTPLETYLLCHAFYDAKNNCLKAKKYTYDAFGNLSQEVLLGNISQKESSFITFGSDNLPLSNNVESCTTIREFSQDGKNLLLKEKMPNKQVREYVYDEGSGELTAKFISDQNSILLRSFYFYDEDNFLIQEITDDGITKDPSNFSGVTERKIQKIHRIQSGHFVGLPCRLEKKYINLNTRQEQLISAIDLHYSYEGKIIRKDFYDNQNHFVYSLSFQYDKQGNVLSQTNAKGQKIIFSYDANQNCTSIYDASKKLTTKQSYDLSNRLVQSSLISAEGNEFTFQFRYNKRGFLLSETDHADNCTLYEYDLFGNLIKRTLPGILIDSKKVKRPIYTAKYDLFGNLLSETDPKGHVTAYQYNIYNKPTLVIRPDGSKKQFTYLPNGDIKSQIDSYGAEQVYHYDALQRIIAKEVRSSSGFILLKEVKKYSSFHMLEEIDAMGYVTAYSYNFAGQQIAEERERERKEFFYDSMGRLITTKFPDHIQAVKYDILNRCIEESLQNLKGHTITKKSYQYDEAGNQSVITSYIEDKPINEFFYYDEFQRLVKNINPLGFATTYNYNDFYQNEYGQILLEKITEDPLGVKTYEYIDAFERVYKYKILSRENTILSSAEQFYDLNGNLSLRKDRVISKQKTTERLTYWEYNDQNQISSLTEAFQTPYQRTTFYKYNEEGFLEEVFKPDAVTITNTYDALQRMVKQKSSDGTIHYSFTYDLLNNLIASEDLNSHKKTIREIDHRGRILSEVLANGLQLLNKYDFAGRRYEHTLPDGSFIKYAYRAMQLHSITRKSAGNSALYTHVFLEYDLAGNLLQEELINGQKITYNRNSYGNIQKVSSKYLEQEITEYDKEGKITALQEEGIRSSNYSYNDLKQLSSEKGKTNISYEYDSLYNRTEKGSSSYTLNELNQITATSEGTYQYDANGNLIKKIAQGEETTYQYDALDRLIQVSTLENQVTYEYDSFHRRVAKYVTSNNSLSNTTKFIFDEQNEIGSASQDNTILELRILGNTQNAERGAAISIEINNQVYIPIHDVLSNPQKLISYETNDTIEAYKFSAFGQEMKKVSFINPWRFSSKRVDPETTLIYFGRRYYDPEIGRWITTDPKGYADGIINLYAYVLNDPLNHFDPYGLKSLWLEGMKKGFQIEFGNFSTNHLVDYHMTYVEPLFNLIPEKRLLNFENDLGQSFNSSFSKNYSLNRLCLPRGEIGFSNGVDTNFLSVQKHAEYISDLSGGYNVNYTYNVTHGLFTDLYEARCNINKIATEPSRVIQERWRKFFAKSHPKDLYLESCHSQGAAHVRNALLGMSESERQRIIVLAIAPAVITPKNLAREVYNIFSSADNIYVFDRRGWKMNKQQATFLSPSLEAGIKKAIFKHLYWDHNFQSLTYKDTIQRIITNYVKHPYEE